MTPYRHVFLVRSKRDYNSFPLDMLRYDACHLTSESIARRIENSNEFQKGESIGVGKIWEKQWTPTSARWESFGWEVISHERNKV